MSNLGMRNVDMKNVDMRNVDIKNLKNKYDAAKKYEDELFDNVRSMKKNINDFTSKNIDLNIIENFSRKIYANPTNVAWVEMLQYLVFFAIIYFYNPLNINSKHPVFSKILLLFVAFIYVVLFYFIKYKVEKGDDVDLIDMTESNFIKRALITIVLFVVFALLIHGIIWMFKNTSILNGIRNSMTTLIVIGIIGILYMFMKKSVDTATKSDKKGLTSLLLKIIMFLPCLMVDLAEYIKTEYNLTTKPVWILAGIEALLITLWLIIPTLFSFLANNDDGTRLLNEPTYLNKEQTIGNFAKLYKNIDISEMTNYSFPRAKTNANANAVVDDTITDKAKQCDAQINANKANKAFMTDPNMPENALLAWFYKKFLSKQNRLETDFIVRPQYSDGNTTPFRYAYALSGWFYINPQPPNSRSTVAKYTNIIKYGNKVKVEYNGKLGSLRVMGEVPSKDDKTVSKDNKTAPNDDKTAPNNELVEIYETKSVMYQKWNNIVINYDKGYLDIFINGNLVGSRSSVSPYMSIDDLIIAGENNGIDGGICNVMFYNEILSKSNITMMYKTLRGQSVPYVWSITDSVEIKPSTDQQLPFMQSVKNFFT
jgi:hypothetical protein